MVCQETERSYSAGDVRALRTEQHYEHQVDYLARSLERTSQESCSIASRLLVRSACEWIPEQSFQDCSRKSNKAVGTQNRHICKRLIL